MQLRHRWVSAVGAAAAVFVMAACGGSDEKSVRIEVTGVPQEAEASGEFTESSYEQVRVGMDVPTVTALLGPPDSEQSLMGVTFMDWNRGSFFARLTVEDGVVTKKVDGTGETPALPDPVEPVAPQSRVAPGGSNFASPDLRDD